MYEHSKRYYFLGAFALFVVVPLMLFFIQDLPTRSILKDGLSILTVLALFLMLGQFFLARANVSVIKVYSLHRVLKLHKAIGYFVIPILLLHPLLIVLPKAFEAGLTPYEALTTILTTFDPLGVLLGMIAWSLMLLLGITSMFRDRLGMEYDHWKVSHGLLSVLFIMFATWHAIDLGRHINMEMSLFMATVAISGSVLLLKSYLSNKKDDVRRSR